jgi:hypothetical protein
MSRNWSCSQSSLLGLCVPVSAKLILCLPSVLSLQCKTSSCSITVCCHIVLWKTDLISFSWISKHSGGLKGCVQVAGGPKHYPLSRSLYALGLDAYLYRDKLK